MFLHVQTEENKLIGSLIVRIAKCDENALRELYSLYGARMLAASRGITGDRQLSEDAVQEALIKIVRYAKSFRRKENGCGWIMTIVRNESVNVIKKLRPLGADIDEFFNIADTAHDIAGNHEKLEMKLAIEKLTLRERRLIYLRYILDMTVRDIAAFLKVPKSTVAHNLKKAEEQLKKLLE